MFSLLHSNSFFLQKKKFNAIFNQILEPLCLFAFVRWIYIRPTGDKIWVRRVELRLPGLKFFLGECPYVWCKYPWWGKRVWDLDDAFGILRVTSKWDPDTWFDCWQWVSCIQYLTVNIWKKNKQNKIWLGSIIFFPKFYGKVVVISC